jgi:phosphopantothenoylcysteine decarboxylase / phosphopantothenate---cysteine ligase
LNTVHEKLHSDDLKVELRSTALKGMKVAICVGGGIAAIEVPRVARELRRMGASVRVCATENALRFVGRDALEWASTHPVVVHASGLAEHIATDDLVLVFPATADLIAKIANGLCPDACTTYIQSALGQQIPIYCLATMHDSLRASPAFRVNLDKLIQFSGVELLTARVEEGKWKSPPPNQLALEIAYRFNSRSILTKKGRRLRALVTLGGTSVAIDSARSVTNASSGTLGSLIAEQLILAGVETTVLCGQHTAPLPDCSGLHIVTAPRFVDFEDWIGTETNTNAFDALFHVAAVSDFKPAEVSSGKIESNVATISLKMEPLPKLIKHGNLQKIPFKLACKYTAGESPEERAKAQKLLNDNALDAIYWNWGAQSFGASDTSQGVLVCRSGEKITPLTSKKQAAIKISELFMNGI